MLRFSEMLRQALARGEPFALGIISRISGSTPQRQGAKAVFFEDGRILGTLGGGCLEAEIQDRARRALRSGEPTTFELVLDHDFGWDDGLICGGKVTGLILPKAAEASELWSRLIGNDDAVGWGVAGDFSLQIRSADPGGTWLYHEVTEPPFGLWIAGSGHVAQAIAPLALELDFEVTVFDDRPALANPRHFPIETRFRVGAWDKLLREPCSDRPLFGLIVTRGHQHDALVLREWIQRPFAFLGMIGSRRKRRIIFDRFVEQGIATAEQLERVECPVGLDIEAVSVPEIAISIAARLVQSRSHHRRRFAQTHGHTRGRDEAP